jgi:hydrogenase expression/formation protein HypC
MCLGEVGQVLDVEGGAQARVRLGDRVRTVSLLALDAPVGTDDWVLVHSGFALARLTDDEAREAQDIRTATTPEELP